MVNNARARDRHGSSHLGNLLGKLNGLGDGDVTLLNGALDVDVVNLLAEVGLGANKTDQAVLDLESDVGALLDSLS